MKRFQISALITTLMIGGTGLVETVVMPTPTPDAIAQPISTELSWSKFTDIFRRKRTRGGARCPRCRTLMVPIAFGGEESLVWNPQPMFVWQGVADAIEVRRANKKQRLVWASPLTPEDGSIQYQGKRSLKPGKIYTWLMTPANNGTPHSITFKMMSLDQRKLIQSELDALELQLQTQYGTDLSEETLAMHRTHYFKQQNMISDAMMEIFQVKEPSDELKQLRRDLNLKPAPSRSTTLSE